MIFLDSLKAKIAGSLRAKVILGVCLILVTLMGVFTYWDMVTGIRFHLSREKSKAFDFSNMVMKSIEYPMLDGEMEDVQAILESLNALEDLEIIDLHDLTGTIKYSGDYDSIGKVTQSEITKKALRTQTLVEGLEIYNGERILRYAMPIPNERACYKCHGREEEVLGILTVGIRWTPVENRVDSLRNRQILLTIIFIVVVSFFLIRWVSKSVTRPILRLTRLMHEIRRGNLDVSFDFGEKVKCWELLKCEKTDCPAYGKADALCWYIGGTLCKGAPMGEFTEKLEECRKCKVYKMHSGDEIGQLADGFSRMTSDLKASQEELRHSEEKYRLLFDGDPSPIFILDRNTFKILDANARAESQYGYSKEELLKISFIDLGYEEDVQKIMSDLKGVPGDQCILLSKRQHRRKDGSPFYINIHVCGARYMGRNTLIAATTDIAESIQKEIQLIQASKLATLGEMAAGIAHELNQPLHVVKLGGDFLRKMVGRGKKVSDEQLKTVAHQICSQVNRASGIIDHLREFARLGDAKVDKVDINKPIGSVFKILGQQLRLSQIEIELDLDKNLPPIMANSNRLEQVFINLVANARHAMEDKTPGSTKLLKIRSFVDNGNVVVTISDTGQGIPKNTMDRIFEPFFTTKEVGKGTGLGLSISYGIIKDYGGTIRVESEVGIGTTFELRFPASPNDA